MNQPLRLKEVRQQLAPNSPAQLSQVFRPWAEVDEDFGAPARRRLFSPSRTFWLFLSQVLAADRSCREVLRQFLAWLFAEQGRTASPSAAAYCKARGRLQLAGLVRVNRGAVDKIAAATDDWRWCGRRVLVVDGSGLSMPDTPENQAAWPQSRKAKPGCSFPVMRIVALFSLAAGALIDLAHGPLAVHERTLMRRLWQWLMPGDVLLADRGFGSYAEFHLLTQRGVDCVMRRTGRRKPGEALKSLGPHDKIVRWKKAAVRPDWMEPDAWQALPETLVVREVTVEVGQPGFRTRTIEVVTTLLDSGQYPAHEIAALYRRRWRVELHLRDIKTTMGMDVLSCRSPAMVEKELWMYVIAYNLIRAVMAEAALSHEVPSPISSRPVASYISVTTPNPMYGLVNTSA